MLWCVPSIPQSASPSRRPRAEWRHCRGTSQNPFPHAHTYQRPQNPFYFGTCIYSMGRNAFSRAITPSQGGPARKPLTCLATSLPVLQKSQMCGTSGYGTRPLAPLTGCCIYISSLLGRVPRYHLGSVPGARWPQTAYTSAVRFIHAGSRLTCDFVAPKDTRHPIMQRTGSRAGVYDAGAGQLHGPLRCMHQQAAATPHPATDRATQAPSRVTTVQHVAQAPANSTQDGLCRMHLPPHPQP